MIATAISAIVIAAAFSVLSATARAGQKLHAHEAIHQQIRRTIETFGRDARQASAATWTSATEVRLDTPQGNVTYTLSNGQFTRTDGGGSVWTLATHLSSASFRAFSGAGTELSIASDLTGAGNATKLIQLQLNLRRTGGGLLAAEENWISTRFALRNKAVR
jgi:type II secretory pathway pseudopilin PulG